MLIFLILFQAAAAIITAPTQGEAVGGAVAIRGTASHPQFARYELAFAYDPNPTDTWFEIQPPATAPITADVLGTWNTTQISDGNYMLRLRVYAVGLATPVETIIRDIQVRNDSPTPTPALELTAPLEPTATATTVFLGATATPLPEPSPTSASAPAQPDSPPPALPAFLDLSTYSAAFCNGVYVTLAAFALLGGYVILRDRIKRPFRKWIRRIQSDSRKP